MLLETRLLLFICLLSTVSLAVYYLWQVWTSHSLFPFVITDYVECVPTLTFNV